MGTSIDLDVHDKWMAGDRSVTTSVTVMVVDRTLSGLLWRLVALSTALLLDPETGLQALPTLLLFFFLGLLLVLRLFHFTTDRRETSHAD